MIPGTFSQSGRAIVPDPWDFGTDPDPRIWSPKKTDPALDLDPTLMSKVTIRTNKTTI
jgi:hypothetical protein